MIIIGVTIFSALLQIVLLLFTATLIGVKQYSEFSLLVTIGIFVSTGLSEWLRMCLARYAGMRHQRVRKVFLSTVWKLTLIIAASTLALSGIFALSARLYGISGIPKQIFAIGLLAAGGMLNDMVATYFRFATSRAEFCRLTLSRVLMSGGATCIAGYFIEDGVACAVAFALTNIVNALTAGLRKWGGKSDARGWGFLKANWKKSWSMASSALSMSASSTAIRSTLGFCLPTTLTGGIFLSLDLGTRGLKLLGTATSTWSNRDLFDAAHSKEKYSVEVIFKKIGDVSLTIWFSVALYGVIISSIIPSIVSKSDNEYIIPAFVNLLAIHLIFIRVFIFDSYLSSLNKTREIALSSIIYVLTTAAGVGVALLFRENLDIALYFAPLVSASTMIIFLIRNGSIIFRALSSRVLIFVALKILIVMMILLIVVFSFSLNYLLWVALFAIALDALWAVRLFKSRSATA